MAIIDEKFMGFLRELSENNNREWFTENKPRFEADVKAPFLQLVEDLRAALLKDEPELDSMPAAKMIFRIYRDTRFSKDKAPYKDHVSALISPFGTKDKSYPAHYFHISGKEIFLAGGAYYFEDKEILHRVRSFLQDNNERFEKLLSEKDFAGKFGGIQGEKNKRIPKEFAEFEKIQPLIANTQFYWAANLKPEDIIGKDAVKILKGYFDSARKLNDFFKEAISPK